MLFLIGVCVISTTLALRIFAKSDVDRTFSINLGTKEPYEIVAGIQDKPVTTSWPQEAYEFTRSEFTDTDFASSPITIITIIMDEPERFG